jgi:4-diphosphocytidyl-2-C-methyl-D-erythritol kinase
MPNAAARVTLRPAAKVNLTLEVPGRRPDGYHELSTLFQEVGIHDELTAEPAAELSLAVEGDAPPDEDNLVLRAARLMSEAVGGDAPRGASISLRKGIPSGAGLGGGSSDAAATLLALNYLWDAALSLEELARVGRELGADVPFFLYGGTALGRGRGDEIEPLARTPSVWFVLSTPPFRLGGKTGRIFRGLRPDEYTDGARTLSLARDLEAGAAPTPDRLYNGLLVPALREFPELAGHISGLVRATGRPWTLAGAGPTCFCLASTEEEAAEVRRLVSDLPGQTFVAPAARRSGSRDERIPLPPIESKRA